MDRSGGRGSLSMRASSLPASDTGLRTNARASIRMSEDGKEKFLPKDYGAYPRLSENLILKDFETAQTDKKMDPNRYQTVGERINTTI